MNTEAALWVDGFARTLTLHQMKLVRSDDKNLPLYYLALFSRHDTAYKFWKDVLKYSTDQSSFWE